MTEDEQEQLEGALECTIEGVMECTEGYPIELRRDMKTGRLFIVAFNEGHNNMVQIDLWNFLDWLAAGPAEGRVVNGGFIFPTRLRPARG